MKKLLVLLPLILPLSGCVVVVTNPDNQYNQPQSETSVLTTAIDDLNNTLEQLINKINRYR